jgi:hypothetical protein
MQLVLIDMTKWQKLWHHAANPLFPRFVTVHRLMQDNAPFSLAYVLQQILMAALQKIRCPLQVAFKVDRKRM